MNDFYIHPKLIRGIALIGCAALLALMAASLAVTEPATGVTKLGAVGCFGLAFVAFVRGCSEIIGGEK